MVWLAPPYPYDICIPFDITGRWSALGVPCTPSGYAAVVLVSAGQCCRQAAGPGQLDTCQGHGPREPGTEADGTGITSRRSGSSCRSQRSRRGRYMVYGLGTRHKPFTIIPTDSNPVDTGTERKALLVCLPNYTC